MLRVREPAMRKNSHAIGARGNGGREANASGAGTGVHTPLRERLLRYTPIGEGTTVVASFKEASFLASRGTGTALTQA